MVDLSGGSNGPIEHAFNNAIFIIPGILVLLIVGFFGYRLFQNLREKERKKEGKKKQKQQKKESKGGDNRKKK